MYFMNKLCFVALKSLLKNACILEMLLNLTNPAWIMEYSRNIVIHIYVCVCYKGFQHIFRRS